MIKKNSDYTISIISDKSFKFEDLPYVYPIYIMKDDLHGRFMNFLKIMKNNFYSSSRRYQLNNRSTQEFLFDSLIKLSHFKLLGIDDEILTEVPIINTDKSMDNTRIYYLLDHFIPSKSIAIELDSGYHDLVRDELKDKFLNSIGIEVYRIKDFHIDIETKLDNLVKFILSKDGREFIINHDIDSYPSNKELDKVRAQMAISKSNIFASKNSEMIDKMYNLLRKIHISPKKAEQIAKLSAFDENIFLSIINETPYSITISLDDIFNIIPMTERNSDKYRRLVAWMHKHGIELIIIPRSPTKFNWNSLEE